MIDCVMPPAQNPIVLTSFDFVIAATDSIASMIAPT